MGEIPDDSTPLERIIHQAFHDIANKYDIDVDLVAKIIREYDELVNKQIEANITISAN